MLNKSDFFQEQIKKCNGLAERASNKADGEFWLQMARRWEAMLEAGERGILKVEVEPGFERPIMKKRAHRATNCNAIAKALRKIAKRFGVDPGTVQRISSPLSIAAA